MRLFRRPSYAVVAVRLFDADHNIISVSKAMLRLADRQADSIPFVVTVTNYPPVVVHYIPPVEAVIPVHMNSGVRTGRPT